MPAASLALAALLGIIEGVTEFLPVSSTGHLIFFVDVLRFGAPPGKVFEIVIQLGAILAIVWLYRARLFGAVGRAATDRNARRFLLNVLLAFVPSAVIGALAQPFITTVLFSPWVVAGMMIAGGFAILAIERWKPLPRIKTVDDMRAPLALAVGFCQVVSMIPGVSRSGATIMGGLILGLERRAATEFSFFLAIPTMVGAAAYELWKNRSALDFDSAAAIAVAFVAAFVSALIVVRAFVGFVARHDFTPFAWYRLVAGTAMVAALLLL
ncbi:MAG: undecaprenyl-diphosphate phosphatase [Rhodospirillaceae bacterium]|nr:undecaprenyl-diphosphate phosphatase [Rhodospirillaceae bacterium]